MTIKVWRAGSDGIRRPAGGFFEFLKQTKLLPCELAFEGVPQEPGWAVGLCGFVAQRDVDGAVWLTNSDIYEQDVLAGRVPPGSSYQ